MATSKTQITSQPIGKPEQRDDIVDGAIMLLYGLVLVAFIFSFWGQIWRAIAGEPAPSGLAGASSFWSTCGSSPGLR